MLSILLVSAAVAASVPLVPEYGIDAPYPNSWNGVSYAPTPFTVAAYKAYRERLAALRREALGQQASDGGTLNQDHRVALQRKLDRIQFRFAEDRRRADMFAVDANGDAVYSASNRPQAVLPPGVGFVRAAE